jgi:predicted DNA-binding protein
MNRTQIYITDKEQEALQKEAESIGISKAELIRRILDKHIEESLKGVNREKEKH